MKGSASLKRVFSLICVLLLCAALLPAAGCAPGQTQPSDEETLSESQQTFSETPGDTVTMPYTSADSLNPYFIKSTLNSALISLIYRSLYYLDAGFTAQKDIAANERVTGTALEVSLAPSLLFSDGSSLGSADVVYSFNLAKSSPLYSAQLAGIASCAAIDGGAVIFQLSYPDVNVLNALSFPIVKLDTASSQQDAPIGGGYYKYTQDGIRLTLTLNQNYGGALPALSSIRLSDAGENSSLEHLVDTGDLDFCYSDLSEGSAKRTYANVTQVYLNNLVYLGVNSESTIVGLSSIRRALSLAVDRQNIVANAFQSYARSAGLPFNTSWAQLVNSKAAEKASFSADTRSANELLSAYGAGSDGRMLSITLICPDSNSFMKNAAGLLVNHLSQVNITLNVRYISSDNYMSAVRGGEYDLYFAEVKLPGTMDLSAFFSGSGAAAYGINLENSLCDDNYFRYRAGEISLDEFIDYFLSELPFIPLCYRNARLCSARRIVYKPISFEEKLFSNIAEWAAR